MACFWVSKKIVGVVRGLGVFVGLEVQRENKEGSPACLEYVCPPILTALKRRYFASSRAFPDVRQRNKPTAETTRGRGKF